MSLTNKNQKNVTRSCEQLQKMQFTNSLDNVLGQRGKIRILRYLSRHGGMFTGREIAKNVGVSHPQVHEILSGFTKQGIVLMQKLGNAYLYSLSTENELIKEIIMPIFQKEQLFIDKLTKILIKSVNSKIESMILFGSIARGDESPDSDIDILIVLPNKKTYNKIKNTILSLTPVILKKFGNQISPLLISKQEFILKLKAKNKLFTQILKDGKVVYGKSISELITE